MQRLLLFDKKTMENKYIILTEPDYWNWSDVKEIRVWKNVNWLWSDLEIEFNNGTSEWYNLENN